jgi:hypothetical protein
MPIGQLKSVAFISVFEWCRGRGGAGRQMAAEQLANRIPKEVYTGNDRRKMETE